MMCPKETKKVEYLAQESAYFTNQCWKESRRVIMLDYAMGREHFVDMGEQMHRHIYEINLAWGQMLDFYTDLNNARKEQDDSYAEKNYIGEEVIEPDEVNAKSEHYDQSFVARINGTKPNWDEAEEDESGNLLGKISKEIDEEQPQLLTGPKKMAIKTTTIVDE